MTAAGRPPAIPRRALEMTQGINRPKTPINLAEIIELPVEEFIAMEPAPGHRDSEGRAQKATHLRTLVDEHGAVDIAEYPDEHGQTQRRRMTGNTRAQVWKCGQSDRVPEKVQARIYRMKNEKEVRERMLFHDSREQSWTSADHMYRAYDMTYSDTWRPTSKPLKSGRFVQALRVVDALTRHGKWSPDLKIKIELIMPGWATELKLLDQLLDHPLEAPIREKKPFTWGFLAGILFLLRYIDFDVVRAFMSEVFNDHGNRNDQGINGVQALIEHLGKPGTVPEQQDLFGRVLGCFDLWETEVRVPTSAAKQTKVDAMQWHHSKRDAKREERQWSQMGGAAE
jgi:hypothetical protein